jgi:hypothetical protein
MRMTSLASVHNVKHSAGTNASCRNEGYCRIKNLTKTPKITKFFGYCRK